SACFVAVWPSSTVLLPDSYVVWRSSPAVDRTGGVTAAGLEAGVAVGFGAAAEAAGVGFGAAGVAALAGGGVGLLFAPVDTGGTLARLEPGVCGASGACGARGGVLSASVKERRSHTMLLADSGEDAVMVFA